MPVLMSLRVGLTALENSTWVLGVVARGVGLAGKNTVLAITTLRQANGFLGPKTITPHPVVAPRKDSKRRTIALEAIQDIVERDGLKPL